MVIYNPKDWWKLIFAFHKSDTFRMMLPGIIGVAIFTGFVVYLENDVFHATFKNTTAIHTLVGFVLSMLLVFRTNTAYERWWEGRKTWGSFVNNSRNLALKLSVLNSSDTEKAVISDLISNYIYAVKEHLRGRIVANELTHNRAYPSEYYQNILHLPNRIMKGIYQEINKLHIGGKINDTQLLHLNEELKSFTAGPFTVFAPTNAAFDKLPKGTVEDLLKPENKGKLSDILSYHTYVGNLKTEYMQDGNEYEMVLPQKVKITKQGDKTFVNGVEIVATIETSNGIIHVINDVLLRK